MSDHKSQEPYSAKDTTFHAFKDSIFEAFSGTKDPRHASSQVCHLLSNVLVITLTGILCGANNLKEVAAFAKSRQKWLEKVLDLPYGVPCYCTFWWVFALLDPQQFGEGFLKWMQLISVLTGRKIIAIDGKALRGTAIKGEPNSFIHIVTMWACEAGISLGQMKVNEKSNEITAIPKLLELIDIKDSILTIDAMGTQTKIAEQIKKAGADYILALKGNHSKMHDELENFFSQAETIEFQGIDHSSYHTVENGHGRHEKRHIYATEEISWLPEKEKWMGLKSIVLVVSKRTEDGKTSMEKRLYISSLPADARKHAYAIRSHWGIENQLHWILDVAFQEDAQKARTGHIAENMNGMRKLALSILKQDTTTDGGIELKRKKAGWDLDYLLSLLGIKSF
ncbi:MAG TPA: ISAs1 family transposase [Waddliaceae bacterium]